MSFARVDTAALWEEHRRLSEAGEDGPELGRTHLELKCELAGRLARCCTLCERKCGAARHAGEAGACGASRETPVSRTFVHVGEEPCLVPSFSVYLQGCNWRCRYCSEASELSSPPRSWLNPPDLARQIEQEGASGARTVNFGGGNPDAFLPGILETLSNVEHPLPVIWNSNAYCSESTMRLLDGVVDTYLFDLRYGNDTCAARLSGVPACLATVRRNLLAAYAQGQLIVRHLVLPDHVDCCSLPALDWLADELPDVRLSLLLDYVPLPRGRTTSSLCRRLSGSEVTRVREHARARGLTLCPAGTFPGGDT